MSGRRARTTSAARVPRGEVTPSAPAIARVRALLVALAVLWIALAWVSDGLFLSPRNLVNLAVQASAVGVMACGMVLVIAARQIDLSVGSVLGVTGMVIAGLSVEGGLLGAPLAWPVALLAGLVLAIAIGVWHGAWVAYARLPSFVVTLAGLLVFRGAAWLVSDGRTLAPLDETYTRIGGGLGGTIAGVPLPVLVLAAVALFVHVLATRTRFGRHVFAIGGSPLAAELAGIDVRGVTLRVFALMGALAGVAAVLTTARLGAGTNSMGSGSELAVIAAAVLGGTSLAGGAGSVAGAVLGALWMQSLENGMVLLDVTSALRQVVSGLVLLIAVAVDARSRVGSP
jgi:ABC-type xylose transport system permease subunit